MLEKGRHGVCGCVGREATRLATLTGAKHDFEETDRLEDEGEGVRRRARNMVLRSFRLLVDLRKLWLRKEGKRGKT